MIGLHVGLHDGHASCHEAIGVTGETHLVMFTNMVIEGLIVRRPKSAQRAEVGVHAAAC